MADIARLSGVSKPTVSRVLNGSPLVAEATRERVLAVVREHDYRINRTAQRLRQTRAESIGVVLDFGSYRGGRIADPFVFDLLAGVSDALAAHRLDLLLLPPRQRESSRYYHDQVAARMVDGFIFLGQGVRDPMLVELAQLSVPFVVWGAVDPAQPYCAVGSDNQLGGRLAAAHFVRGARRNWLFVGDPAQAEVRLRFEGLKDGASDLAGPVATGCLRCTEMSYLATYREVSAYLEESPAPDAVFAYSDTAAMAVIAAFRQAGLEAPRDYALVGYNNLPQSAHFTPAITTIEQQTQIAGTMLVEKLVEAIGGGQPGSTLLPTRLIVRAT
jgi:DNA-binding LacI/PurR family transcriptional regulator